MPVKVLEADDADMDRIYEIACEAFARNEPIWDTFWPNHWTEKGRKQGAERMRLIKNSDPNTTYLKAVDEATGEIIGMAKWNVYDNCLPDSSKVQGVDGDYWDTEADKAYCTALTPIFLERRNAAIERTKGNLLSLDILAVHPAHQRKKVGDALVKWGVNRADELGVEAVVESSVFGKGLYLKNGFVFQENVSFKVPGWEGREAGKITWLVRPKIAIA